MIDRKGLEKFFWSIQDPNEKGSYLMHVNGEADIRAVYIVVIMVVILKLEYLYIIKILVQNYWMVVLNTLHHVKHMKEE